MGDDGNRLTFEFRQLRDAGFPLGEPGKQSDPGWLSECAKNAGRAFDSRFVNRQFKPLGGVAIGGTAGLRLDSHKINVSTLAQLCKCTYLPANFLLAAGALSTYCLDSVAGTWL